MFNLNVHRFKEWFRITQDSLPLRVTCNRLCLSQTKIRTLDNLFLLTFSNKMFLNMLNSSLSIEEAMTLPSTSQWWALDQDLLVPKHRNRISINSNLCKLRTRFREMSICSHPSLRRFSSRSRFRMRLGSKPLRMRPDTLRSLLMK